MNTFPKSERLCGQMRVQHLYREGQKFVCWPLRVTFLHAADTEVLVWAPKALFKHAVERNRLRRQIKEAWRLNKNELNGSYQIAFNYMDKVMQPYAAIDKAVKKAIHQLNAKDFA